MADYLKSDLVRHERFGIGRVVETVKGGSLDCEVFFPRLDKQTLVDIDDLQALTDAEATSYELLKLVARELRGEETPAIELGSRWHGGEMILKAGGCIPDSQVGPDRGVLPQDRYGPRPPAGHGGADQRTQGADRCGEGGTATVHYPNLWLTHDIQYPFQGQEGPFRGQKGEG